MNIAIDTSFYLAFARLHSARYLSDRAGETVLLEALTDDEEAVTENRRLRAMAHVVPLLGDLPIATLMRIRGQEREAFARYQYALRNLLNDSALQGGEGDYTHNLCTRRVQGGKCVFKWHTNGSRGAPANG